jgi:hypothetical protein
VRPGGYFTRARALNLLRETGRLVAAFFVLVAIGDFLDANAAGRAGQFLIDGPLLCVAGYGVWRLGRPLHRREARSRPSSSEKNSVHSTFVQFMSMWLDEHTVADSEMDAVHPRLAAAFGSSPVDFSFDRYRHEGEQDGWMQRKVVFPSDHALRGLQFPLYLKSSWTVSFDDPQAVEVRTEDDAPLLHCFPTTMEKFRGGLLRALQRDEVLGFAYLPKPDLQTMWVYVSVEDASSPYECYGVYSIGESILMVAAAPRTPEKMNEALISLMNSEAGPQWSARVHSA